MFRIWGKVIGKQLIAQLSEWLPPQVTGFLKGRSAFSAAYANQFWIEHATYRNQHHSGVTLDLVKCCNLVRRIFAGDVLRLFRCPEDVINKWTASTKALIRFWELDGIVSISKPSTTGLAEGDPIAVAIMVSISAIWVFLGPPLSPSVNASAFADNWSWAATDPSLHKTFVKATKAVCAIGSLEIDPAKT